MSSLSRPIQSVHPVYPSSSHEGDGPAKATLSHRIDPPAAHPTPRSIAPAWDASADDPRHWGRTHASRAGHDAGATASPASATHAVYSEDESWADREGAADGRTARFTVHIFDGPKLIHRQPFDSLGSVETLAWFYGVEATAEVDPS